MAKVLGVKTLRLHSSNFELAKNWYSKLLMTSPSIELESFAQFNFGITLFEVVAEDTKSPSSKGGSVGYIEADDLKFFTARAEELGGKIYRGPLTIKEENLIIIQIEDPFGGILGFQQTL